MSNSVPKPLTLKQLKVLIKDMSNEDLVGELNGFPITGSISHDGEDYEIVFSDDDEEESAGGVEGILTEAILSRMEKPK